MRSPSRWVATLRRERQGARRQNGFDPGVREGEGVQDGEDPEPVQRSSAGTPSRVADRQAALHQQVADKGARDRRPAVDVKRTP